VDAPHRGAAEGDGAGQTSQVAADEHEAAGAALVSAAVPADKVTNLPTFGAPLSVTRPGLAAMIASLSAAAAGSVGGK
jgi:hypothetical protein